MFCGAFLADEYFYGIVNTDLLSVTVIVEVRKEVVAVFIELLLSIFGTDFLGK